jgi:cytochrome c oxidase subunit 3
MNVFVASIALVVGILVWWMAARRLTSRSWQTQGTLDGRDAAQLHDAPPAARVGLWVLLAVITSFFALFMTAYLMRMSPHLVQGIDLRDWRPVREPAILWFNTLLLLTGSVAMQLASSALHRWHFTLATWGLAGGGAFAIGFLLGQWLAWQELRAAGVYAASNPAGAFFYTLTALHALHLFGGLLVWARALVRMLRGRATLDTVRLSVELCTTYWHYLLAVWVVLFALLLVT